MLRKWICLLLCAALFCASLSGCAERGAAGDRDSGISSDGGAADTGGGREYETPTALSSGYGVRAAVVHSGGNGWQDTLYLLQQSPMLGLSVQGLSAHGADLSEFDVLYLDESLLDSAPEGFAGAIEEYVRAGGAVFLPNGFCNVFSKEFLGVSDIVKVAGCCNEPEYPALPGDEGDIQQIIRDFSDLYTGYADFPDLSGRDYGYGVLTDAAIPLVSWGGVTVYALNKFGEGTVFFTNPLLPSAYSSGSPTMEREEGDGAFASTTLSFNQLLLCSFAEYIAKEIYGFSLQRVHGYFGTPSMAWELHYEEITGIENGSLQLFSQMCEEYYQIPSFTLIRNSYTWFLRAESVTYLLNQSTSGYDYQVDMHESAYSSGTHIDAGGQWLSISEIEDAGSYFVDYPEYTLRAYPQALDNNGDGFADILSGSEDGCVYYYEGLGFADGRLKTSPARALTDETGQNIDLGSFSAPQLIDINGDGENDLICGWKGGEVYWFAGSGGTSFEAKGVLLDTDIPGQALPSVGDINGDGVIDLAVGSDKGILIVYFGAWDESAGKISFSNFDAVNLSKVCVNAQLGNWLAPATLDYNGDGLTDLIVGTFDGYLAVLLATSGGGYEFSGYITADEMNYKGNSNLKFGNWAAPCFFDLDGNGQADLICGSQEYGLAYPIDSGYFPYEEELRRQVEYVREHDYYMGVHFYTNAYASQEREAYELSAHKAALEYYGLDLSISGANQHTWYTSSLGSAQTMSAIYDAGLYWQSGFASPGAAAGTPQVAAENVVSLPFFLMEDGEMTTLVQNNSTLLYADPGWYALSARYNMPVCIYYHCDFAYESEEASRADIEEAQTFRENYGYNFNREDQLMLASAAALNQTVEVAGSLTEGGVSISLSAPAASFDLYDEDVYNSLGVKMVLSSRIDPESVFVGADIWYRSENTIVLGLNRDVSLSLAGSGEESPHIRRINMAADVSMTETGARVEFLGAGMMELSVEGKASTDTPGWAVQERENETVFISFGDGGVLDLIY